MDSLMIIIIRPPVHGHVRPERKLLALLKVHHKQATRWNVQCCY